MFVYVLSKNGNPLMPTKKLGKVRHMLKDGRAKVVQRTPFTIQLTYETTGFTQEISLGVDAGSKVVGLSATTEKEELFASNVILRNDVVKLLADRRMLRAKRRGRKTRYRPIRFLNRTKAKKSGWIPPSVKQKLDTHIQLVKNVNKILPISETILEIASFDIQRIKNPDITNEGRQHGEQEGFWNVREYVLFRDNHECQHCHGKSGNKILNVHHIESRKTGGNTPNNLITLCKTCHEAFHKGKIKLRIKRGESYKDASFMNIMREMFYNKIRTLYSNVSVTYGCITKKIRIESCLSKDHKIDARCISGNPTAKEGDDWFLQVAARRHNRKIHKMNFSKGGERKANQGNKFEYGFQLFDKVLFMTKEGHFKNGFVFSRRKSGKFVIRDINKILLEANLSFKRIKKLLEKRKTILIERRTKCESF